VAGIGDKIKGVPDNPARLFLLRDRFVTRREVGSGVQLACEPR
jgi:hypothetical protein